MRGFITILIFSLVCLFVNGQAANQVFLTDSTKGAETIYNTGTKASSIYQGVAGFIFTTSHDTATVYLQGCWNTSDWHDVDTVSVTGSAAVQRELYQAPPRFKYYRLKKVGSAGDTCIFQYTRYYLKY